MKTFKSSNSPAGIKTAASKESILGRSHAPVPRRAVEPITCFVCETKLPVARASALRELSVSFDSWCCVRCSDQVTTPRLGIFMGEVGTSELKIVDRLYNDSVRDMFADLDDTNP